tara:strand:- start:6108 stop:6473 length:366 start_codon:yes stop_codon:yes gene_type:complete
MIKTNRIPKEVQEWANTIQKRNPALMVNFYSPKALLLATFESLLVGKQAIYGYFVEFLDKEDLQCEILENYTQKFEHVDICSGLYAFTFIENGEEQRVVARYTYCVNNKGKITTHHSSVNP